LGFEPTVSVGERPLGPATLLNKFIIFRVV